MVESKRLKTTCLAVAGIATAWGAAPTPANAAIDQTVSITSTATMNDGVSLTNPQFLYVSNTSTTVPGTVSLPASNFGPLVNSPTTFNIVGKDDEDFYPIGPGFNVPSSISYTIVGLAPNGDLVAGLNASSATAAIAANSSFDSLFPPLGNEAALIAALGSPGAASDSTLAAFANTLSENTNIDSYAYFNDPFPIGGSDPGIDSLTLVDFGHIAETSIAFALPTVDQNSSIGSVAFSLTTQVVPEPASLALIGAPLLFMLGRRKRR